MNIEEAAINLAVSERNWEEIARIMLCHFDIREDLSRYKFNIYGGGPFGHEFTVYLLDNGLVGWYKKDGWVYDREWPYVHRGLIFLRLSGDGT